MVDLCVVMPVYNESESIEQVVTEWRDELERLAIDHRFLLVDDGSTDDTADVLRQLAERFSTVSVLTKANSGHGQTCVYGYRAAIDQSANWILQIDGDGQCDPCFFERFWSVRTEGKAVQGFRRRRDDGLTRVLISQLLSVVVFLLSGRMIKDLNVPYRLMDGRTLKAVVDKIPADFQLPNVLVSYIYSVDYAIEWIAIGFRRRFAGHSHLNKSKLIGLAMQLIRQMSEFGRNR
jgi:dolichol-phosphate mannosyltransferase